MKIELDSIKDTRDIFTIFEMAASNEKQLLSCATMLKSYSDALTQFSRDAINQNIAFTLDEAKELKQAADLYKIMLFNLKKGDHVDDFLNDILEQGYNSLMTVHQYVLGELGLDSHFYASEINLNELVEASKKALDATDTSKPIKFIQVA